MKNITELMGSLHLDTHLSVQDIPDLDLYMDQVIQLFENTFAKTKRNEEEKVLTKTMINNYAKGKLFFPIQNKKYTKEHIMLISMIYQMKSILSINDIKITLNQLNTMMTEEEYNVENLYASYLNLAEKNVEHFKEGIKQIDQEIEEDDDYIRKLLLVATFTHISSLYRRAAEKIVDEIDRKQD